MTSGIEKVVDGVNLAKAGDVLATLGVDSQLSAEGEKYAVLRAMGYTPIGAVKAIGGTNLRATHLTPMQVQSRTRAKAARFENSSLVKQRIETLVEQARMELAKKSEWSRGQAINALKVIVDVNVKEIMRFTQAIEDEIDDVLEELDDGENLTPDREAALIHELRKLRRRKVLTSITNQGVTNAVAELNKMHGFSETTVKHDMQVSFIGEESLLQLDAVDVTEEHVEVLEA